MASHFYALDVGENEYQVVDGASTQSKTVEIVVELADNATRDQVLVAIDNIKNYILRDIYPPA
jgi:hypothetical protein